MSQPANWGVPLVGPATPTEMASQMQGSLDALLSAHKGAARPAYATAGTLWVDDNAGTTWSVFVFDGASDILIGTLDTAANAFTPAGAVPVGVGPLAGLRNLLINALGTINQRSYASGAATSGANQYTLDRWFVATSGQNVSWTESEGVRTFTAPAGGFGQVIEGASVVGGTYTLNWEGTATATVNGTTRAKGESFTLTGGQNVIVRFFSGTVSKPQLEPGSVATPFEMRPRGLEEVLCRRYRQSGRARASGYFTNTTSEWANAAVDFGVPMRTAPGAISLTYVSGNVGAVRAADITAAGFSMCLTPTGSAPSLMVGVYDWTADVELTP